MDTWMFEVYMGDDPALEARLIEEAKRLGGILDCREDDGKGHVVLTFEYTDREGAGCAMEALTLIGRSNVHIEGPSAYG
jgi:hypothetical protein